MDERRVMDVPARVLVVEDDPDMVFALRHNLERHGLVVEDATDGEAGLLAARRDPPDLIVLDVMLPRLDGFRVLRTLRSEGYDSPVLMLTARSSEPDKVYGFRVGADDYVTKPFGLHELLARIDALLRRERRHRRSAAGPRTAAFGDIVIDFDTRVVRKAGREVALKPRAYELLLALYLRRDTISLRQELMRDVWGYADGVTSRTLDAHVAELRRKLEDDPAEPRYLHTAWRAGYRLDTQRNQAP
jgi:two-component system, OmpR family, alkaline phosphatase synthesis response regulator PhoP